MIHYFLILSAPLFNEHCESNIRGEWYSNMVLY